MSYILDALRRAERERHLGQTPTVQSLTQATASQHPMQVRRWLRPALAVLMLGLVVASAWMLWLRAPRPETPAAVVLTAPPTPPPVTATVSAAPLPAVLESAEAASVIDEAAGVESLDDVAPEFSTRAVPPADTDLERAVPSATDSGTTAAATESSDALPRAASADTATTAAPSGTLPKSLREMPSAYRTGFPAIALDVHVYDPDPARRWIMTGGRRYNEGETLAAGPRLVSVVPEGVIMEHAGERVLLPLNR